MDFFHSSIRIISRNKGKCAVAAAAYRSGTKLTNTRDGVTHDYTRKRNIIHSEIMLPAHAPLEYKDRSVLWNSVEWSEPDRNAQLAREIELSLPAELSHEQQLKLVRSYIQKNFVDEGMCADFSLHDKRDGNPHVHILLTMRPLREDGTWASKSRLVYVLDKDGNRIPGNGKGRWKTRKESAVNWNDRGNAEKWRAAGAEAINEALREAGFTAGFVDHRSYKRQGVDRVATIHEGPTVRAMECKGIRTEIGDENRAILERNKLSDQLRARLSKATGWARYEAAQEQALKASGQSVANPALRYRLFSATLNEPLAKDRKDRRLKESCGLLNLMHEYDIQDAASYLTACKKINEEFYRLQHDIRETDEKLKNLAERVGTLEQHRAYRSLYSRYQKLPTKKQPAFYEANRADLVAFEAADKKLQAWKAAGETIGIKQWKQEHQLLDKERFFQEFSLKEMKEKIRSLEAVKRAYIQDKKREKQRDDERSKERGI